MSVLTNKKRPVLSERLTFLASPEDFPLRFNHTAPRPAPLCRPETAITPARHGQAPPLDRPRLRGGPAHRAPGWQPPGVGPQFSCVGPRPLRAARGGGAGRLGSRVLGVLRGPAPPVASGGRGRAAGGSRGEGSGAERSACRAGGAAPRPGCRAQPIRGRRAVLQSGGGQSGGRRGARPSPSRRRPGRMCCG